MIYGRMRIVLGDGVTSHVQMFKTWTLGVFACFQLSKLNTERYTAVLKP